MWKLHLGPVNVGEERQMLVEDGNTSEPHLWIKWVVTKPRDSLDGCAPVVHHPESRVPSKTLLQHDNDRAHHGPSWHILSKTTSSLVHYSQSRNNSSQEHLGVMGIPMFDSLSESHPYPYWDERIKLGPSVLRKVSGNVP